MPARMPYISRLLCDVGAHIPWDKGGEIGWLLGMQYLESDGSNLEI